MYKAVIYDVDGTLVNSEPLHVQAWGKALNSFGRKLSDLSPEFQATMAGKKPAAIAEGMVEELGLEITGHDLLERKAGLFLDLVKTDIQEMPGALDSIKRFSDAGLLLGIGTSLDRPYIDLIVDKFRIRDCFKVIVTGDEIANGKPHPDTYLTVASKLGVAPRECVVLEDAATGIKSAKAAGCYCIAITNPDAVTQDLSLADRTVQSWDEVTLASLA